MVYVEVKVADIERSKRWVRVDCLCPVSRKNVLKEEVIVLALGWKFDKRIARPCVRLI